MRNNKFLMLAALALPMFVGCNEDSQDNTDKNKSEENVTAVTGITLSASSLSLAVGKDSALTFTINPSDATNKNVTWSSNDTAVAKVSNGVVRGVAVGVATISVKTADGNKTDTCAVTVVAQGQAVSVTGVTLTPTTLSLIVGGTDTLTAAVAPENATNKAVTWSVSPAGVVTVSNAGLVTAVAAGTASITVTTADGGKTATCEISVNAVLPPVEQVVVTSMYGRDTIRLVTVEGGHFTMGCNGSRDGEDANECYDDEKPLRSISITYTYKIGKYEVTQKLWHVVMGSLPNSQTSDINDYGVGDNYPVYYVSWNDVQTFLTNLNNLTGRQFRLPMEWEWEYAARGGNQSQGHKYSGNNTLGNVAWYYSNSGSKSHVVGTKAANELGIYDMSGNVLEWCADWYGDYSSTAQNNPTGPASGSYHVLRGGGCNFVANVCRATFRYTYNPDWRDFIGFRVALPVE
jgi:formylglycine-generating enzyme required for sulfatase activity